MKLTHSFLATLIALIALTVSVLTGCGPAPQSTTEPKTVRREEPPPATNNSKNYLFVTENVGDNPSGEAVSEISILKPQRAMLRLAELQVGRPYEATWRLFDGRGRSVFTNIFPFTAREIPSTIWAGFKPDYRKHEAGRWKWTVDVPGLGRYYGEIGVLPATPTELAELARFEKARESVFRAFSQYWLGYTNDCFTTFTQAGTVTMQVVRKEAPRRETDPSMYMFSESELRGSLTDLMAKRRAAAQQAPGTVEVGINTEVMLQVRGLNYSFSQGAVSEADRLNGVNYRGAATFGFRLYRFFVQGKGWSDWQDVVSAPSELMEALAGFLGMSGIPGGLEGRLVFSFEILERDGNWFVTCNNGDRFSNGKLVSPGKRLNAVPILAQVQRAVLGGVNVGREEDKQLGKFARDNPVPLEQEIIATMTQLRGRQLP